MIEYYIDWENGGKLIEKSAAISQAFASCEDVDILKRILKKHSVKKIFNMLPPYIVQEFAENAINELPEDIVQDAIDDLSDKYLEKHFKEYNRAEEES
jgi:hypothetical protein